jgi:hypothetical protein
VFGLAHLEVAEVERSEQCRLGLRVQVLGLKFRVSNLGFRV